MADLIETVERTGVILNGKEVLRVVEVPQTTQPNFQVFEEDIDKNIQLLNFQAAKANAEREIQLLIGDTPAADDAQRQADTYLRDAQKFEEIKRKVPAKQVGPVEPEAETIPTNQK